MVPYILRVFSHLIRIDFSKHVMKAEFHGYQRKGVHRLKWCLRVFMGLGSLSLIYAFSSSFVIFLAYAMLSKTFSLRQWIFSGFSFHFKPLIKHIIDFSFLKFLYLLISRYQHLFSILFISSSMIFLFFGRQSCMRNFCLFFRYLCVFSRFVI
jgi:sensor histidine kinase YesM